jgi:hypothetical protein
LHDHSNEEIAIRIAVTDFDEGLAGIDFAEPDQRLPDPTRPFLEGSERWQV